MDETERAPIEWHEYQVRGDGRTVKGRRIGPHIGVHRCDPSYADEVTLFSVTHLPSGYRITGFSSELHALEFATEMREELGDERLATLADAGSFQEASKDEKVRDWLILAGIAGDDDCWPPEQ
jgi:hypothetical protein